MTESQEPGKERRWKVEVRARFGDIRLSTTRYVRAETEIDAREKAAEQVEDRLHNNEGVASAMNGDVEEYAEVMSDV